MTLNSSIKELNELGERFHNWKKNNPCRRFPKEYWADVFKFTAKYSLDAVAKSIGYAPSYILRKQQKKWPSSTLEKEFVEIQPSQTIFDLNQIRVHIHKPQGTAIELSFHGGVEQLFPLIHSLFKEGEPCFR